MNKYILLAITALCLQDMQAQTVVHPSIKTKTTFAIVVDQKSYDEAKSEIDAYRTSIEKEGLGYFFANCKCDKIAEAVKEVLA